MSLEPILEKTGSSVALWSPATKQIYSLDGDPVAVVVNSIIICNQMPIGLFRRGRFLDNGRKVVGFIAGAIGTIVIGSRFGPPLLSTVCQIPPEGWSRLPWHKFIEGSTSA